MAMVNWEFRLGLTTELNGMNSGKAGGCVICFVKEMESQDLVEIRASPRISVIALFASTG